MSAYQETKVHGTHAFPYAVYLGLLPERLSSFPLHWHEEMEIIYVQDGTICAAVRNTEYLVSKGEFVLIHPQTIHAIKQHNDDSAVYFNILFRFSMLESGSDDICREHYFEPIYSRKLLMPEFIGANHPLNARITPLIQRLLVDPRDRRYSDELIIKARLFEIMHGILRYCMPSDKNRAYEDVIYEKLKQSLRYLEENFAESITVGDIAAVSNYSASHFEKLFKELTGHSFTQYLKNYRLEQAADRIKTESAKISDIATACGFSNLSYFSRAFYQKYGMTPSDYRKTDFVGHELTGQAPAL